MDHLLNFLPILLALAYVFLQIFDKKGKGKVPPKGTDEIGQDEERAYTWEDMEKEYGIKIERPQDSADPQADDSWAEPLPDPAQAQEEVDRRRKAAETEQVELARQAALQEKLLQLKTKDKGSSDSGREADQETGQHLRGRASLDLLRQGVKWSMILEKPKGLRNYKNLGSNK